MPHGSYTHRVTCNLHAEHFTAIAEKAAQLGMRVGPFIRHAAIGMLKGERVVCPRTRQLFRQFSTEICRIGTNINHIARRANVVRRVTFQDLFDTTMLMKQVDDVMQNILAIHSPCACQIASAKEPDFFPTTEIHQPTEPSSPGIGNPSQPDQHCRSDASHPGRAAQQPSTSETAEERQRPLPRNPELLSKGPTSPDTRQPGRSDTAVYPAPLT